MFKARLALVATVVPMLLAAGPGPSSAERFEKLVLDLRMFPTHEFAFGRGTALGALIPKKVAAPWYDVYAALRIDADDVADIVRLLKHKDPKVRTLALAALLERQDPRLIPHFAAMLEDKEKTVPEVQVRRAIAGIPGRSDDLLPEDYHEQTVGQVAQRFLESWLEPAGYRAKDFAEYWAPRRDRAFCASWFLARLKRAEGYSSHVDPSREGLIRAIRKDIDALAAMDRDWTLLWVAASDERSPSQPLALLLAAESERVAAGQRLGADRLMELLEGKPISTDPDLALKALPQNRAALVRWVLSNAAKLLRPEDAPIVLELGKTERRASPRYALAAAELQPARAHEWLHGAMDRFAGKTIQAKWARAELAAGLWRMVGVNEIDYLADWFYGEKVDTNPHSTQTGMFLDAIKGVRAPVDRKLLARLIRDPRLPKLDYQSLQALIGAVNPWTKGPAFADREARPIWEHGTWGPETARDFQVLATLQTKLRASLPEWAGAAK